MKVFQNDICPFQYSHSTQMRRVLIAYTSIFQSRQSSALKILSGYRLYASFKIRILYIEYTQRVNWVLHSKNATDMKLFQVRYVTIDVPQVSFKVIFGAFQYWLLRNKSIEILISSNFDICYELQQVLHFCFCITSKRFIMLNPTQAAVCLSILCKKIFYLNSLQRSSLWWKAQQWIKCYCFSILLLMEDQEQM